MIVVRTVCPGWLLSVAALLSERAAAEVDRRAKARAMYAKYCEARGRW